MLTRLQPGMLVALEPDFICQRVWSGGTRESSCPAGSSPETEETEPVWSLLPSFLNQIWVSFAFWEDKWLNIQFRISGACSLETKCPEHFLGFWGGGNKRKTQMEK